MRAALILLAVAVAVLLLLALVPVSSFSREIAQISVSGTCRELEVTVTGENLGESCWDVKIDLPGEVYSSRDRKWMSGFYYLDKAICYPETGVTVPVRIHGGGPETWATAKLRQGSRIIEQDFLIRQSCPQPLSDFWSLVAAFVVILVFGWSLTWWWKQDKTRRPSPKTSRP